MAYKEIKNLLEKYWQGETSILEEQKIKKYFAGDNVADELKPYKSLFNFFDEEKDESSSPLLEESILNSIGAKKRRLTTWKPLLRVAAAVLIFALGGLVFYQTTSVYQSQELVYDSEPEDALKAYNEVKAALALVSNKMDKGTNKAVIGISKTKSANDIFKILN